MSSSYACWKLTKSRKFVGCRLSLGFRRTRKATTQRGERQQPVPVLALGKPRVEGVDVREGHPSGPVVRQALLVHVVHPLEDPPEKALEALDTLLARMEGKAMEHAKRQVEDEERKKERQKVEEKARQRLDHFLKAKAVLDS